MQKVVEQMHNKKGYYYWKWRRKWKASIEKAVVKSRSSLEKYELGMKRASV
jgi:hypothetical protein